MHQCFLLYLLKFSSVPMLKLRSKVQCRFLILFFTKQSLLDRLCWMAFCSNTGDTVEDFNQLVNHYSQTYEMYYHGSCLLKSPEWYRYIKLNFLIPSQGQYTAPLVRSQSPVTALQGPIPQKPLSITQEHQPWSRQPQAMTRSHRLPWKDWMCKYFHLCVLSDCMLFLFQ